MCVCAYLHNSHPNISDQTDANIRVQGSDGLRATSQSTSEARSFHKAQRGAESENSQSRVLPSTEGGTFHQTFREKKWMRRPRKQMVL